MNSLRGLGEALATAASAIVERIIAYLPSLLGAVMLLIVGWALARVLRALTMRAVLLLDRLFARVGAAAGADRFRVGRASTILAAIVFWVVVLFFITAATQVLGLQAFTDWLKRLIEYLPTLVAGILIVAAGYFVSRFVGDLVRATTTRLAATQRAALGRITQVTILVGAVLVGADQIGIKVTVIAILAAAVATAIVGGVAIAVGFGARTYIANLIGAHYLREAFSIGQVIRVAGHEGRILEVTPTVLILETDDGRVSLPGRVYNEEPIAVISRPSHG